MNGVSMYTEYSQDISQNALVETHAGLVKRIAYHLIARLPHTVEVDDLIQAGMLGLLDAAQQYNADQGASFETYAGIRIRGAMLDEIRRNDWAPRSVHRKAREIAETLHHLEQQLGRPPHDQEVAKAMQMTVDDYHQQLHDAAGHQVFSLDELNDHQDSLTDRDADPDTALHDGNFRQSLAAAIDQLPERERVMMSLYYNDELNLKEIGQILGVSESRVSQIHSQTVLRLRGKLQDWLA